MITRTEVQRVPVEVYRPVPERLYEPLVEPQFPAQGLDNGDLPGHIAALRRIVQRCQADRQALEVSQRAMPEALRP